MGRREKGEGEGREGGLEEGGVQAGWQCWSFWCGCDTSENVEGYGVVVILGGGRA